MSHSDLTAVLRQFTLGRVERIEALDTAGGWSGSQIWRVTAGGQTLCLRRWPAGHPTPDRLGLIHHVLTHAAAQGIDFVPVPLSARSGEPYVQQGGHLWELTPWLPGVADYRDRPSRPRLAAAMVALARFHAAVSGAVKLGFVATPVPAVAERFALTEQLLAGQLDRIAGAVGQGLAADLDERAARILALTEHRVAAIRQPLAAAAQLAPALQPAIRDVHHDHVLFTGERVTGLVDFGALRIDTPLADVARLVGSLVGDDPPSREFALQAYSQVRPLSTEDRRLIDLLDEANVVLSGLNWLRWLYLDRRDMGPSEPVLHRLDEIVFRLK